MDRFNLAQLITGSEGTLAMITDATLQLVPRPKRTGLAVVHFDRLLDSCAAVSDVLETEPSAAELLDKMLMDLARVQPEWAKKLHFVEGDPAAVLLVEYYGDSEAEVEKRLAALKEHLWRRGWKGAVVSILDPLGQADVWSVRKAGLNILTSQRGDFKPVPGIEDVSVPPEQLDKYLSEILDFCKAAPDIHGVAVYAHASAGCLHVRPMVNIKQAAGVATLQAMGEYACDVALKFGGTMSGEHGDGLARSALHPQLFGPELYEALRAVKRVFDADNRMNPGKIVDAPPLTENLRFGPHYETIELQTVFDWREDGSYAQAIEMCNGAGVCRKLDTGTMCPSYMATRDEHDTTRGRANALRNALAGRIPPEELYTPEMHSVMDLCLGCKACKSECPSSVDLAKIKAEYSVHYYRHNGLPLFNRLMGLLPQLNELLYRTAQPLVPVMNSVLRSPLFKQVQARIGVHPERTLPQYASQRFSDWFHGRGRKTKDDGRKTNGLLSDHRPSSVVLFHDTWHEFNYTGPAKAAVAVLEAAGYTVHLAEGRACCGRPLITGGQADKAKAWVDHNVALLAPLAAAGIPIVGIEPSCILTLRDEYLSLASDRERAIVVANQALTFEEFMIKEVMNGGFEGIWREKPGKALLHGHCHQKALVGNEASLAALAHAGYEVSPINSGCCGMAGDFGYESDHYEVSQKIAEDRLLPAVRKAAADTVIVASGVSCRQQIGHFSERKAVHMAEALEKALR